MSVIFKKWAKFCLPAFGLVLAVEGSLVASAGESEINHCNEFGECYRAVGGSAEILKWCETTSATIAWNHKRKGAFLVSCDCECTSHDNVGWIVDKNVRTGKYVVQKLQVGKQSTVESIRRSSSLVLDRFSEYPYCGAINSRNLSDSVFVTLLKEPTDSDAAPYCFYPAYIVLGKSGLEVKVDGGGDGFGTSIIIEDSGLAEVSAVLRVVSDVDE